MMLLFLMIPCGDIVQPLLRDMTLKCLEWFAILGGLPHSVDGYHITFGEHEYEVLSACSGLGLFTLAGFLGYSFGLMLYHSLPRVLAMAALGAMLGILANCLRVCLIVTLDLLSGTQMELADHKGIQWLVTLLLLGGLLVLVARLKRDDHMGTQALPPIPA
jgi:exosortase/archaeosortase family protein